MERYLRRKGLSLNTEKSKVICFRKGEGKRKLMEWRWGKTDIEEVAEIRYLGYVIMKNGGGEERQIRKKRRQI